MIGNEATAKALADFDFIMDDWQEPVNCPVGFTFLGSGAERLAFLADGIVYKRDIPGGDYERSCYVEWENYNRIGRIDFPGIRLAECALYSFEDVEIIAMEYVQDCKEFTISGETIGRFRRVLFQLDIMDGVDYYKRGFNWHVNSDGVVVVTDYTF